MLKSFVIVTMPQFGFGIVVLLFIVHCSLIFTVNIQCCYNIVVGLVLQCCTLTVELK